MDEGVIKFNCHWTAESHGLEVPEALMHWRDHMHALKQIGIYEKEGIGYGNISLRLPEGMLISGTQTGHLKTLNADQYALVTDYSIAQNSLHCTGLVKASAESLTHLAFYEADPSIQAIIHIHNAALWHDLMDKVPTSDKAVPYGTGAMAAEIKRLFEETDLATEKLMAMGGHDEGLIAFGATMDEAGAIILDHLG